MAAAATPDTSVPGDARMPASQGSLATLACLMAIKAIAQVRARQSRPGCALARQWMAHASDVHASITLPLLLTRIRAARLRAS